jgi:hypothetical protein
MMDQTALTAIPTAGEKNCDPTPTTTSAAMAAPWSVGSAPTGWTMTLVDR